VTALPRNASPEVASVKISSIKKINFAICVGLSAMVASTSSIAQQTFLPSGSALTRGAIAVSNDLNSTFYNPAAPSFY
jgi:hypothetical protein